MVGAAVLGRRLAFVRATPSQEPPEATKSESGGVRARAFWPSHRFATSPEPGSADEQHDAQGLPPPVVGQLAGVEEQLPAGAAKAIRAR